MEQGHGFEVMYDAPLVSFLLESSLACSPLSNLILTVRNILLLVIYDLKDYMGLKHFTSVVVSERFAFTLSVCI